jgi:leucyl-tRNA synthetase
MVLAPEHEQVLNICTPEQKAEIENYISLTKRKTERERKSETKMTGVFTGAYAINPFTKEGIPIWIADYILAEYGTGAIMAVPGHDTRDYAFAKQFSLPVVQVVTSESNSETILPFDAKDGYLVNSDFLNGLEVDQAIKRAINEIELDGLGKMKVNYRLRDANFSRQRYWGEPFPIVYKNDLPYPVPFDELPVVLPDVESYKPTGTGESPLASATEWVNSPHGRRETNTMPGWAGSSWYMLRYMDPNNDHDFVDPDKELFWKNVDFYIGGAEHATGLCM